MFSETIDIFNTVNRLKDKNQMIDDKQSGEI